MIEPRQPLVRFMGENFGLIGPIYGRFIEGLTTPDLVLARQILEQTSVPARRFTA